MPDDLLATVRQALVPYYDEYGRGDRCWHEHIERNARQWLAALCDRIELLEGTVESQKTEWDALRARLEAAEKVCRRLGNVRATEQDPDSDLGDVDDALAYAYDALDAWESFTAVSRGVASSSGAETREGL